MNEKQPNQLEVCLDLSWASNDARIAGRRVTSIATIKPVPLTSENAKRVRATPVEDKAMAVTFFFKS